MILYSVRAKFLCFLIRLLASFDLDDTDLNTPEKSYILFTLSTVLLFWFDYFSLQRPMETTVEIFYKMLIQEEVEYIVMLCNFTEKTEKKCPEYYPKSPSEKPMTFGTVTVTCCNANNLKTEVNVKITGLEIKGTGNKKHMVKHCHCQSWPERGFPEPTFTFMNLLCAVRGSKKPIVVHCSDGNAFEGERCRIIINIIISAIISLLLLLLLLLLQIHDAVVMHLALK
ncbi:unnamed protein product [Gongylonema pulchrum]|uniref:Tyrosine-protein phosphatase domain-containing protein n=1 Tax=Gongylonema pulchrum TaxID=637853 RepID=A0A183D4Q7_9BILA|nr:unnamed protein product [Gongylonema pulchrum]